MPPACRSNIPASNRRIRTGLVVDGNRDIDELKGSVGVAEGGDDDMTGLLKGTGDVVGEGSGSEMTSNRLRTSVCGELEDRTVAVRAGRNYTGLASVDDVDA